MGSPILGEGCQKLVGNLYLLDEAGKSQLSEEMFALIH